MFVCVYPLFPTGSSIFFFRIRLERERKEKKKLCSPPTTPHGRRCVVYRHIHTTYIHTYIRTYTHTYKHTYKHTYIYTYVHMYIYTYIHNVCFFPGYLQLCGCIHNMYMKARAKKRGWWGWGGFGRGEEGIRGRTCVACVCASKKRSALYFVRNTRPNNQQRKKENLNLADI